MLKRLCLLIWIVFFFYPMMTYTQSIKDSVEIFVRPYAGFRGHLAVYERELEIQENASRAGTELSIKTDRLTFIVGTEVQISMFKGGQSFNADGNLSGGFLIVQSEQKEQVFTSRLGYLGLNFEKYGSLIIGKQWSVYRDVTSYTDRFSVFGARASATFIGGTDGGTSGTGRADQSIIYRNQIGLLHIGAQVQAREGNNDRFIDGFGASVQVEIRKDFFIGTAYNRAYLNKDILQSGAVLGLSGHPTYFSLGAKYIGDSIDFSIIGVLQKNGDFAQGYYIDSESAIMTPSVVFDAKGLEVFGKYKLQKTAFLAGYNLYVPNIEAISSVSGQYPIDSKYRNNDIIIGVVYEPIKLVQIYGEQRVSLGENALGFKEQSVFVFGMKIEFSKQYRKQIGLD